MVARSPLLAAPAPARWAFVASFVLWAGGFGLAQLLFPEALFPAADGLAQAIGMILQWSGMTPVHVASGVVEFAGTKYEVVPECLALGPTSLFLALCLSFPACLRERILGGVAGAGALAFVNLLRLVGCAFVLVSTPALFPLVHDVLWQVVMVGASVVTGWVWIRWVRANAS